MFFIFVFFFLSFSTLQPESKEFFFGIFCFCVFLFYKEAINFSNKYWLSFGPGELSGWNWTLHIGAFLKKIPSLVPSFIFVIQTFILSHNVLSSMAKE
jgi:hypothetical protein